jgi:hypothetical protein
MKFKRRSVEQIAGLICGNNDEKGGAFFEYRSSSYLTRFFQECETRAPLSPRSSNAVVM